MSVNQGLGSIDITEQSPVDFASGDGYVTQATLQDANQQETKVMQYLRILPDGFHLRVLILGDVKTLEELSPAIQSIQSSVEPQS